MTKILALGAAAAITAAVALTSPAGAAEPRADGLRNADQIEVSSARRHRRVYVRRYYGPRYYGGPYYDDPYYAYGYYPYRYYRPGPYIGIGPFGFGFGWY